MDRERTLLRLDPTTMRYLRETAKGTGKSMAAIVRDALGLTHECHPGTRPVLGRYDNLVRFEVKLPLGEYGDRTFEGVAKGWTRIYRGDSTTPKSEEWAITSFDGFEHHRDRPTTPLNLDAAHIPNEIVDYVEVRAWEHHRARTADT